MASKTVRRALWHFRHGGMRQLRTFLDRRRLDSATPRVGRIDDEIPTFEPWPFPERAPLRAVRVGIIADDFTRDALVYEWDQTELHPDRWAEQIADAHERPLIDLLFVESAWHGNKDAWQYHLTGPSAPRPALVELVDRCRELGIPTVFWNKEDPVHYEDFLDTARLFDHVWTTDADCIPRYDRDLGRRCTGLLPFAAQPAIHNPIRPQAGHAVRDIGFGGMYFAHKYPERREQMDLLLGAAAEVSPRMDYGLEIFSRYLGHDERYQFPEPLDAHVVGSLDYRQMLSAYRAYKVFCNVNSVVDSRTMCARRVFEITACGTPVVSTPSPAIAAYFPESEVARVASHEEARFTLRALVRSPELRDRMVHLGQRRIWRDHTYGSRVDSVLVGAGLEGHRRTRPSVSLLVSTNRPHQIDHVLDTAVAFVDVDVELCLVTHGFELSAAARSRAASLGLNLEHRSVDSSVPLGGCLNRLIDMGSGDVFTKLDDDDEYGQYYLSDQLHALDYSGADIVGKQAHYVRLVDRNLIALRFGEREHRFTDLVMGPTILGPAEVFRRTRFEERQLGEDTAFLRAVTRAGGTIYSSDRFNFTLARRGSAGGHTWNAGDSEILANSTVAGFGQLDEHIFI